MVGEECKVCCPKCLSVNQDFGGVFTGRVFARGDGVDGVPLYELHGFSRCAIQDLEFKNVGARFAKTTRAKSIQKLTGGLRTSCATDAERNIMFYLS